MIMVAVTVIIIVSLLQPSGVKAKEGPWGEGLLTQQACVKDS